MMRVLPFLSSIFCYPLLPLFLSASSNSMFFYFPSFIFSFLSLFIDWSVIFYGIVACNVFVALREDGVYCRREEHSHSKAQLLDLFPSFDTSITSFP
ncbi:hypothetical protein, unlikely [Trypanosoma brucei brucei TREU927]|uniref:Uncharacterized protein n=1 Tax=Trypanosoma brucei brucei (strain 927/4 GUTat10.1) TaxID=185431 RepID=Q38EN7_TRYB2|nr:hypothetical protein, unlikely [Trypanosoma brucei brucei TREU927]EAN76733.1 hypothetical protein, unlikely [Trypanosoma brucei brucei TREU927]